MSKNLGQMGISMLYIWWPGGGLLNSTTTAVHSELKSEKKIIFRKYQQQKQTNFILMFRKGFFKWVTKLDLNHSIIKYVN